MSDKQPVIIVGGGWAGLAAAIELCRHHVPVTLLESARQLGGRARSVVKNSLVLDNGQHLLLGAYHEILTMMDHVGLKEEQVFRRQKLGLTWLQKNRQRIRVSTLPLPAPWHLAGGLLFAQGLSLRDKFSAIRFCDWLQRKHFTLSEDCSVASLLQQHQSSRLIRALWEPLCIAALNTHTHEASAIIFLNTLRDSFTHKRTDSDLLVTCTDLSTMLPNPATDFIEGHGGNIKLGQRVTGLKIRHEEISGVLVNNQKYPASQVILATPHSMTRRLVKPHSGLQILAQQLQQLTDRPICTIYLQYPAEIRLEQPMLGLLDSVGQWIFDRGLYGQPGLMAVVISGDGEHMRWDVDSLCDTVASELAQFFPHWPSPTSRHVIREKRATFASTVGIQQHRPATQTPVKGLWIAGDYTDIGLPATLEGAVRSGLQSARQVLSSL